MDTRFYCVRDRVKLKHFDVVWKPGVVKLGDFLPNIPLQHITKECYLYIYTVQTLDRLI